MPTPSTPVVTDINFDKGGKQVGRLRVPRSTNASGWSGLWIGVGCIANGDGPTVLVLAGNHGDEYEGQITALNLLRMTEPGDVSGRIIIIPCLSPEASAAGTRLWPSGANFNRSFPGSPSGSPAEVLADYLTRELFPMVDVVIDMHSGGRGMMWQPTSHMHLVDDVDQRNSMIDGMVAWNTDHHLLYIDVAGSGLLPSEAERQGKVVITTELGGGAIPTVATLEIARSGLANVLRQVGVLSGSTVTRADLGKEPASVLDATDARSYVAAPESGLYEVLVSPGDDVVAGQSVGQVYFLETIGRPPLIVTAPFGGRIIAVQGMPIVAQGDCVAVVGRPLDLDEVRAR